MLAAWQGPRWIRRTVLDAHLALPDRDQPLPQRDPHGPTAAQRRHGISPESCRPEPTRLGEVAWLETIPPTLSSMTAAGVPLGPEARYEQTESISLAFVNRPPGPFPPRQPGPSSSLRDVLGFSAKRGLPGCSTRQLSPSQVRFENEPGPTLALQQTPQRHDETPAGNPNSPARKRRSSPDFVNAYESAGRRRARGAADRRRLHGDATRCHFEYQGRRPLVARFFALLFGGRRFNLLATPRQRAAGIRHLRRAGPDGVRRGTGLITIRSKLAIRSPRAWRFRGQRAPPYSGLPLSFTEQLGKAVIPLRSSACELKKPLRSGRRTDQALAFCLGRKRSRVCGRLDNGGCDTAAFGRKPAVAPRPKKLGWWWLGGAERINGRKLAAPTPSTRRAVSAAARGPRSMSGRALNRTRRPSADQQMTHPSRWWT